VANPPAESGVSQGSDPPPFRAEPEYEFLLALVRWDYAGRQHHARRYWLGAQRSVRRALHVLISGDLPNAHPVKCSTTRHFRGALSENPVFLWTIFPRF
jgi:hypothetical protein